MRLHTGLLAFTGSLCMLLSLVLAWGLAGARSSSRLKSWIASPQYLLKAHLDFLMMTGLLFVFFLTSRQLGLEVPAVVVAAMCAGSVGNPLGFLALALKPDLPQRPASVFGAVMLMSFTATTVGYGGAAWIVARAVLLER
ncbi:MAG: hypothetical protein U0P30_10550 [Vicinamibacterales bacterium]